jgi:hypothetical protein
MRTLKFRAWSFADKKFYHRVLVGNTEIDDPCSSVWDDKDCTWKEFDKFCGVIQQFTGLLDKNGKEIYEGDIIVGKFDLGLAGWIDHKWAVQWHNELNYQWNYWKLDTIEVIGNIFENPELVK